MLDLRKRSPFLYQKSRQLATAGAKGVRAKIMKIIRYILALIFAIAVWGNLYVIMDDVTKGEAYGFKVGDSKADTYNKAMQLFKNEDLHTWNSDAGSCKVPSDSWLAKIEFSEICKLHMLKNDVWWFHFGDERLNNIRIIFIDNKVKNINRHRHFMEAI